MIQGVYQSAAAIDGLQAWNDVIARNIAAATTPGFKRESIAFEGVAAGLLAAGSSSGGQFEETAIAPLTAGLQNLGGNLYAETAASGVPELGNPGENGFGTIQQGFLEASNVNVVEEMLGVILAQRAYEIDSKSIQTSDELLQRISQLKR